MLFYDYFKLKVEKTQCLTEDSIFETDTSLTTENFEHYNQNKFNQYCTQTNIPLQFDYIESKLLKRLRNVTKLRLLQLSATHKTEWNFKLM